MTIRLFKYSMNRDDGLDNYGDLMSAYIVDKVSNGAKIKLISNPDRFLNKYVFKHFLCIGSIMKRVNRNSIVWGSGIMRRNEEVNQADFRAVRGPLSRKRLIDLGYDYVPEVYGDPAILMPRYFNPEVKKTHELGIMPHFVDYEDLKNEVHDREVKVINLLTDHVESTTREILTCKQLISSSLHGVIVGQSYGIPTLWVRFSDKLVGDNVKFYDYYTSVGISFGDEIFIPASELTREKIEQVITDHKEVMLPEENALNKLRARLLDHCPFHQV